MSVVSRYLFLYFKKTQSLNTERHISPVPSIIAEVGILLVELYHHLRYDFVAILNGDLDVFASAGHDECIESSSVVDPLDDFDTLNAREPAVLCRAFGLRGCRRCWICRYLARFG